MPTFTRTYTQAFVNKVGPATLWLAKQNEGEPHIQAKLADLGASQIDGVYQIDSVGIGQQVGLLFDLFLWRNYQQRVASQAQESARVASLASTNDDFEFGG